jgi:plasmid stabilization system protein ParE
VAVGDYLIIYRPIEGGIVRVLHGRRDINALFSGRS